MENYPIIQAISSNDYFVISTKLGDCKISTSVLESIKTKLANNLTTNDDNIALSASQGKILDDRIKTSIIQLVNNLEDGGINKALSAEQGKVIGKRLQKVEKEIPMVVDNLYTNNEHDALSTRQGMILQNQIIENKVTIVDSLLQEEPSKALSASKGKLLNEIKADSIVIDNNEIMLLSNGRVISGPIKLPTLTTTKRLDVEEDGLALDATAGKTLNEKIDRTYNAIPKVANLLSITNPGCALDAVQGKVLFDLIKDIKPNIVIDEMGSESHTNALSARIGKVINTTKFDDVKFNNATGEITFFANGLDVKKIAIPCYNVVKSLNGGNDRNSILSADVGITLTSMINRKVDEIKVVDGFIDLYSEGESTGKKVKLPVATVSNTLNSSNEDIGLSANMGRVLNENKIDEVSIDDNVLVIKANGKVRGEFDLAHTVIVNHLNESKPGKALDALQGKLLNSKIDLAINAIPELENSLDYNGTDRALNAKIGRVIDDRLNAADMKIAALESKVLQLLSVIDTLQNR